MDSSLTTIHNVDIAWDAFNPYDYYCRNYGFLLPEDRQIMRVAGNFLAEHFGNGHLARRAIDVGAGANLYPALLMLPWGQEITLADVAQSNVGWLSANVYEPPVPWPWQKFWDEISWLPGYRDLVEPEKILSTRSVVEQRSVFELQQATWELGSMFFVADGMTEDADEFAAAVESFVRALRPGAPFVAAFMKNSQGYTGAGRDDPAVGVYGGSLS